MNIASCICGIYANMHAAVAINLQGNLHAWNGCAFRGFFAQYISVDPCSNKLAA